MTQSNSTVVTSYVRIACLNIIKLLYIDSSKFQIYHSDPPVGHHAYRITSK